MKEIDHKPMKHISITFSLLLSSVNHMNNKINFLKQIFELPND